ncbi:MAG: type II/IV secretion system protein [Candidatus Omnitrophica bacterium]|nr:type II/IV secretion system protein [Candidatus Omnitrophota bacterium]
MNLQADQYVDQMFREALNRRASDVHFEPHGNGCHVLLRIDGRLREHDVVPLEQLQRITARLKVLAGLPAYERDVPMDGHLAVEMETPPVQARVSIMPTIHGEKSVVRFFHNEECSLDLEGLRLGPEVTEDLLSAVRQRQGVLLFTGPSGSGKTTTIYALLERIYQETHGETNIVTLEDPVERDLGFAAQTPLSKCKGQTYSQALSHILRQDPEVIVIGEIRDPETAQIAIRAGLTGHLVISTLHSRDASEVFLRLLEMGVEGYLVASAVVGVVAQRLLRSLCDHCKREVEIPKGTRSRLHIADSDLVFEAVGCPECASIGYRNRVPIAESLSMSDDLREAILSRRDLAGVRRAASGSLSITLPESAGRVLGMGVTSPEEVLRVLPGLELGAEHAMA